MRVVPIANTVIRPEGWDIFDELGFDPYEGIDITYMANDELISDGDIFPEFAGRACYESYHRPNPATASNEAYLKNTVVDLEHESILEHSTVSFYVSGVSRNLLLELERHRHISFSVISTRYVSPDKMGMVIHPNTPDNQHYAIQQLDQDARDLAKVIFDDCRAQGMGVKESREVARQVLPGNTETKFVVTGNLRAWRYIVNLRWHPKADKEIQDFAEQILTGCKKVAPNCFQDFPDPDDIDA